MWEKVGVNMSIYQNWFERVPIFEDIKTDDTELIRQVKCCPICCGRGFVDNGFYSSTKTTCVSSTTGTETCRSCNGKGYIII